MRALSLSQPWATLVVEGAKQVETRSWRTGHRGVLAIHASSKLTAAGRELADRLGLSGLPLGAVLGTVEVTACLAADVLAPHLDATELALGDYSAGRWAWALHAPSRLGRPVPARGALGLWRWEP